MDTEKKIKPGFLFERVDKNGNAVKYPAWRYHDLYEPLIVKNAEEDLEASKQGYFTADTPITAHQGWNNFYHDLEDMNNRQLCKYAKDEYQAELPEQAPKAKLLWAIWQIAMASQKTKGRIVLLAQSMRMNLDETHEQIRRMAGDMDQCDVVEEKEIWL